MNGAGASWYQYRHDDWVTGQSSRFNPLPGDKDCTGVSHGPVGISEKEYQLE